MGKDLRDVVPDTLNDFNLYIGNSRTVAAVSKEVHIPALVRKTVSTDGNGGTYDTPIPGKYEAIEQEIPLKAIHEDMTELMDPIKSVKLTLRGAVQYTDPETGDTDFYGIVYVVRGKCKSTEGGSLKPGETMGTKITLSVNYVLLKVNDKEIREVDLINGVDKVNGKDIMEKVRKLC
ncbi:MAG: phage major tail tube protein [Eubacteriales bacterium]|nr:phage major tail tube protein [Eubacteriales bacterium]